ncbi:unnamed protein product [Rotaria socialis]|uniref:F-box/LRR-repeat protein 15-like leucin rich repeat domain-containing protein n=1 Tax=Rotaria socialis TaxID=392032 RepID=A0A818AMJ7_9BILA|nr:unnamed protein product [Rotaria socialis]
MNNPIYHQWQQWESQVLEWLNQSDEDLTVPDTDPFDRVILTLLTVKYQIVYKDMDKETAMAKEENQDERKATVKLSKIKTPYAITGKEDHQDKEKLFDDFTDRLLSPEQVSNENSIEWQGLEFVKRSERCLAHFVSQLISTNTAYQEFIREPSMIAPVTKINNKHLRVICRSCTEICHISITDCPSLTDNCMKAIGTLKQLRVLNLADCLLITDSGIKALTDGPCTARLRELNLTNCMRLSDSSMTNLSRRCKRLAYVKLCHLDQISENGLELIGQMDQLISIDITGTQTSDTSLKSIGNSNNLRSVTLSYCRQITDLGLTKFATSCTSIEYLNLSFCAQLTDNAIRSMAFCCKYLTTLNICSCSLLTDMSLQYLSGVCKYLYEIDISYCHLITDKGLKYLRRNSHYLKRIILVECPNISRAAIDKLVLKIPFVQYHYTSKSSELTK